MGGSNLPGAVRTKGPGPRDQDASLAPYWRVLARLAAMVQAPGDGRAEGCGSPGLRRTGRRRNGVKPARGGSGLRELLAQDAVLGEALHTCEVGLLRGRGVTLDNLRATGERVLVDIIEPLEEAAGEEPPAAPPSSR